MPTVRHRFSTHKIDATTETLLLGTFNPDVEGNEADFFYGRPRNSMWRLLPIAFGAEDLKSATLPEKLAFIKTHQISFIDLIAEVEVDAGEEANYDDRYLDSRVTVWTDVIAELEKLQNVRRVCLTRKTLDRIPNMRLRIELIQQYCAASAIEFIFLKTPARGYSIGKQMLWNACFAQPNKQSSL
jgi:G:T/U-mismatch repair DNA glycosylase